MFASVVIAHACQILDFVSKYDNMEVSLERYNVVYYGWSVLWTHVHNFKLAIRLNQTRDYFINMAGKLTNDSN